MSNYIKFTSLPINNYLKSSLITDEYIVGVYKGVFIVTYALKYGTTIVKFINLYADRIYYHETLIDDSEEHLLAESTALSNRLIATKSTTEYLELLNRASSLTKQLHV